MRTLVWTMLVVALTLPACTRAAQRPAQPPAQPTAVATTSEVAASDVPSDPAPTASPAATEPPAPAEQTEQTEQDEPPASGADVVEAWYVRSAARGPFVEPERRQLAEPTVGVARAAFNEVISGDPRTPGLSTLAPTGTEVLGVDRNDSVLVLDVSDEVRQAGNGSAAEIAFAQQLAHTATQFPGVRSVRLLVEGDRITDLWGHLDWSKPVEPDEFAISPVVISTPRHGATVPAGKVSVSGTANVYEATVELRLVDPAGQVAKKTFTTATCGSGCRGEWAHTFSITEPGRWRVVAAESDPSGGEGGPPFKVARVFTVR